MHLIFLFCFKLQYAHHVMYPRRIKDDKEIYVIQKDKGRASKLFAHNFTLTLFKIARYSHD